MKFIAFIVVNLQKEAVGELSFVAISANVSTTKNILVM